MRCLCLCTSRAASTSWATPHSPTKKNSMASALAGAPEAMLDAMATVSRPMVASKATMAALLLSDCGNSHSTTGASAHGRNNHEA